MRNQAQDYPDRRQSPESVTPGRKDHHADNRADIGITPESE